MPAIIDRVKNQCNLVWLENLNLRGDYKGRIFDWIHEKHPELDGLYRQTYSKIDRTYWKELDAKIRDYAAAHDFTYVRNDDTVRAKHGELPVISNFFYHEQIRKSGPTK